MQKDFRGAEDTLEQHPASRHLVHLYGGLGNQLFQLAWNYWLEMHGVESRLDLTSIGRFHDRIGLLAYKLPGPPRTLWWTRHVPSQPQIIRSVSKLRRYYLQGCRQSLDDEQAWEIYSERDLGRIPNGTVSIGFFQFNEMVTDVLKRRHLSIPFRLQSPTAVFKTWKQRLLKEKTLGIHVRRGDFTARNGLLGAGYYRRAVEAAGTQNFERVVVFSDSPGTALDFCSYFIPRRSRLSLAPELAAAETLNLMASCQSLIGANSTLSWWAAKASAGRTYLPRRFFPEILDPTGAKNERLRTAESTEIEPEF